MDNTEPLTREIRCTEHGHTFAVGLGDLINDFICAHESDDPELLTQLHNKLNCVITICHECLENQS